MPDPFTTQCPDGVWTLIASDQIMGYLYKQNNSPAKYLYTSRMTGNPAPINRTEGVPVFTGIDYKFIIALGAIDIYIMAIGADGAVRYDWTW
jgi:hypothetical protein